MSNDAHQSQCAGWAVSRSGCTTFVEVEVGTAARMNSSPHSAETHAAWMAQLVWKPARLLCFRRGSYCRSPTRATTHTLQFYWHDYSRKGYVEAAQNLAALQVRTGCALSHPRFSMWLCNLGCAACGVEAARRQLCRAKFVTRMWACKWGRVAEPWGPPVCSTSLVPLA